MVINHDESPRLKWRLAVVVQLQRGNDNLVRSATIRTANGVTNRPISKLYPLEANARTDMSGGKYKNVNEDDNNEHAGTSETKTEPKPLLSFYPQRSASAKAQNQSF